MNIKFEVKRHRLSTTQGEVEIFANGKFIIIPAQGVQVAPQQGKDNERANCYALDMAAFRL